MRNRITFHGARSRGGFTLLEVLVAIGMYAVLIIALVTTVYSSIRLREKTHRRIDQSLLAERAVQTIRNDLLSFYPPQGVYTEPILGETLDSSFGRSDELEFYTASGLTRDDLPWGDVQRVYYALIEPVTQIGSNEGMELARYVTRNLLTTIEEEPEPQILMRNVTELEFSYFDGEEWYDSWDSEQTDPPVPVIIKAKITYQARDRVLDENEQNIGEDEEPRLERVVVVAPVTIQAVETEAEAEATPSE